MSASPEGINNQRERAPDPEKNEQPSFESHEIAAQKVEKANEQQPEKLEDIRHEALESANSTEQEKVASEKLTNHHEHIERRGPISTAERDASFEATLQDVRAQMSTPSRIFSKVIHNKIVEQTSDVIGATVARPNAILAGSFCAFVLTLGVYVLAKNLGYPLSGFETMGAFIIGWLIGQGYDFFKVMITGKK